jgi:DNA-binding NtrC family response regulator
VLVLDDEALISRSIERVLAPLVNVELVSTVAEAKARLSRGPAFDAVLCDLMLTDGTGMDLFAWLERHQPALAPKVVFMSGGAFTTEANEFLARVSNKRLEKPFTPRQLRDLFPGLS